MAKNSETKIDTLNQKNKGDIKESNKGNRKLRFYETWTFIILVCIVLPLVFRTFLYSPRHIPSSSMKPTLLIGDYIFISKLAYGISSVGLPFGYKINYFDGRIGQNEEPKRGDIIVFRPPNLPATDYIKRLVGLPHDTVQMKGGKLYINDVKLETQPDGYFDDKREDGSVRSIKQYIEKLPNGVSYHILDEKEVPADNTKLFKVPEGHYFFMGDNRDNSSDSRLSVGFVPEENLIGKAELIFFSNESSFFKIWEWVVSFRPGRYFENLDPLDEESQK